MAEKLDAIISLMETTGRMKDFFDIYYIATTYDIMGEVLQKAIQNTLTYNRQVDCYLHKLLPFQAQ